MKILEADVWVEDHAEAVAAIGNPLSAEYPGLVCVTVSHEQDPPIAQPLPPMRMDTKARPPRMVQDPAPPALPGKVRWRCHYRSES